MAKKHTQVTQMITQSLKITYDMEDGPFETTVNFHGDTVLAVKQQVDQHCERYPVMFYSIMKEPHEMSFDDLIED